MFLYTHRQSIPIYLSAFFQFSPLRVYVMTTSLRLVLAAESSNEHAIFKSSSSISEKAAFPHTTMTIWSSLIDIVVTSVVEGKRRTLHQAHVLQSLIFFLRLQDKSNCPKPLELKKRHWTSCENFPFRELRNA